MIGWLRLVWRLLRLEKSPIWSVAESAVAAIIAHDKLQKAARQEERTAFCPRCGQITDGDRRMDEAREAFHGIWGNRPQPRRTDLDFALSLAYFRRKKLSA